MLPVVPEAPASPDISVRVFQTFEVLAADNAFFIAVFSVDCIHKQARHVWRNVVNDELFIFSAENRRMSHGASAAEQIDSVALAIDNIKNGESVIIGDQTGIGKGRQAAAIYNGRGRR